MGNQIKSNLNNLITPDEAAGILGVSPGTLMVWRSTGRYDLSFVKCGSKVMYHPDDIQSFIKRRTRAQTTQ
jgi:predicted site-specific integrase-resolvase